MLIGVNYSPIWVTIKPDKPWYALVNLLKHLKNVSKLNQTIGSVSLSLPTLDKKNSLATSTLGTVGLIPRPNYLSVDTCVKRLELQFGGHTGFRPFLEAILQHVYIKGPDVSMYSIQSIVNSQVALKRCLVCGEFDCG